MKRPLRTLAAAAAFGSLFFVGWAMLGTGPVAADNCGSFDDCFGFSGAASEAATGLAFLAVLSLLTNIPFERLANSDELAASARANGWDRALGLQPLDTPAEVAAAAGSAVSEAVPRPLALPAWLPSEADDWIGTNHPFGPQERDPDNPTDQSWTLRGGVEVTSSGQVGEADRWSGLFFGVDAESYADDELDSEGLRLTIGGEISSGLELVHAIGRDHMDGQGHWGSDSGSIVLTSFTGATGNLGLVLAMDPGERLRIGTDLGAFIGSRNQLEVGLNWLDGDVQARVHGAVLVGYGGTLNTNLVVSYDEVSVEGLIGLALGVGGQAGLDISFSPSGLAGDIAEHRDDLVESVTEFTDAINPFDGGERAEP